ncbi:MAG: single-stranded-DNA-specific exonuclease RecJ [gamma proteobacterium symbiont of Bathyaustriella thionipta]|nr:single-stranded-DNA-specific exonuclease RecJ [gamma proteobacterium symbiont of Bathyaustriella thionipta]MCU7950320.1 single-stranded-DNA-specific exonuclease RecJ [gamma proteobacterium symbiont of Bathyaustriella thionipta]MCU7954595.1 single-stranded-DNA-specific exonuclease RecJ [gamma proteobacterium symbiont of Bathyaustriella thionipta]MCU7956838.1 single-stranded-DNA-specific exonuclease RecJ [gamma proteobacterium symbiont of Bathyaustriella thionipta]MCU7965908.1 single-stranded-
MSPLQARIVANRLPSKDLEDLLEQIVDASLKNIAPPSLLQDSDRAVKRIAQAISKGEIIGLLTDYDVDGITSHAILLYALRDFFGVPENKIQHLIGHRIDDGYGISQGLVDRILNDSQVLPDLIITADCGSSDEKQIAQLKDKGIDVIVTDHHAIPQEGIPLSALATINPTRDDCAYPDNTIAGCMVSWLLMSHLRSELITTKVLTADTPKLATLLDFVSLGTVADAVSLLSPTNRAVVKVGLKVLNQLQRPCWQAIKKLLERDFQLFTAEDLGFQIGPRINARSRMSDPYMALHYLCAPTLHESMQHLQELDKDNQHRKETEKDMLEIAFRLANEQLDTQLWSLVVYHEAFHAGVQGIVASRLMEKFGRPVIVLSPTNEAGKLTGSARTIPVIHIRDAIEQVARTHPEIVLKFGGHKGAAGLKLNSSRLDEFKVLFDNAIEQQLNSGDDLRPVIHTDGELSEDELSYETIAELKHLEPFGREFEVPVFEGDFKVQSIRVIGADGIHLMLQLATDSHSFRAVWFRALDNKKDPFPFIEGQFIHAAYQLKENYYRGNFSIQLHIIYASL